MIPKLQNLPRPAKMIVGFYVLLVLFLLAQALLMVLANKGFIGADTAGKGTGAAIIESSGNVEKIAIEGEDGESAAIEVETEDVAGGTITVVQNWFSYDNAKLAHAHHNGQTLLFFTLAILIIMSSLGDTGKVILGGGLAFSVVIHTVGLFFRHHTEIGLIIGGSLFSLFAFLICIVVTMDLRKSSV